MIEPHLISLSDPHYVDPLPGSNRAPTTSAPRPAPRSSKGASKLQTENISEASKMVANPAGETGSGLLAMSQSGSSRLMQDCGLRRCHLSGRQEQGNVLY